MLKANRFPKYWHAFLGVLREQDERLRYGKDGVKQRKGMSNVKT